MSTQEANDAKYKHAISDDTLVVDLCRSPATVATAGRMAAGVSTRHFKCEQRELNCYHVASVARNLFVVSKQVLHEEYTRAIALTYLADKAKMSS